MIISAALDEYHVTNVDMIDPEVSLLVPIDINEALTKIELGYRNCYKSEDKITEGSGEKLIRGCIKRGHESPLEHYSVSFRMITDRGVTHELVRHRLASYSQESTRYCKYNNTMQIIKPFWWDTATEVMQENFIDCICTAANTYTYLMNDGLQAQGARAVLPNCLKTDIVCTMNIRELRTFFKLRTSEAAHPDMRNIAKMLLQLLRDNGFGIFFEDID